MNIISDFNNFLGLITAAFLLICGIYFSIKTGFFQINKISYIFKKSFGQLFSNKSKNINEGLSSFQAFSTSLAGTIGVGNIIGVSAAISIGGAGSIFWMWIAAFAGMIIKYAEIFLTIKHSTAPFSPKDKKYSFAPMNYIFKGTKSKFLVMTFVILSIATSFLMGNMAQVNAVAQTLGPISGLPNIIIGIALAGVICFFISGGLKSIIRTIEFLIPVIGTVYLICGLAIIIINSRNIIPSFYMIFKSAFTPVSLLGGGLGAGIAKAFKEGIVKGVFSNEAGLGSAGLAHGSCKEKDPEIQGLWGAVEVFIDTVVISGITGLLILTSKAWQSGGTNGVYTAFYLSFGDIGAWFTALCILFFAIPSVLSWAYYGESCVLFLCNESRKSVMIYRIFFIVATFAGAVVKGENIWILSEIINSLMIFTNMSGVLSLSSEFFKLFPTEKKRILPKSKKTANSYF